MQNSVGSLMITDLFKFILRDPYQRRNENLAQQSLGHRWKWVSVLASMAAMNHRYLLST